MILILSISYQVMEMQAQTETFQKLVPAGRPRGMVCLATSLGKKSKSKLNLSSCIHLFVLQNSWVRKE